MERNPTPVDPSSPEEISQVLVLPSALQDFVLPDDFGTRVRQEVNEHGMTPYAAAFGVFEAICVEQRIIDDILTKTIFRRLCGEDFCDICAAIFGKRSREEVVDAPLEPLLLGLSTSVVSVFLRGLLRMAYKLVFVERRFSLACHAGEVMAERLKVLAQVADNMSHLASMDALTGLSNRGAFQNALDLIRIRTGYCAVVFIDVDDFKRCNDQFGHQFGDIVLETIAFYLTSLSRAGPGLELYRYGGDEFAVIIHRCSFEVSALQIAWRIGSQLVLTVSQHVFPDEARRHKQTVSVGVAAGRESEIKDILERADEAMYKAKKGGKGRIHVDEETMEQERTKGDDSPTGTYEEVD